MALNSQLKKKKSNTKKKKKIKFTALPKIHNFQT